MGHESLSGTDVGLDSRPFLSGATQNLPELGGHQDSSLLLAPLLRLTGLIEGRPIACRDGMHTTRRRDRLHAITVESGTESRGVV
jgi:hypothetical protein